jgi:hypothetical protein
MNRNFVWSTYGRFCIKVPQSRMKGKRQIRNKNRLWWPCLLTDRDGLSNLSWGPSIDASSHVSDHLAKQFQRRRFLEMCSFCPDPLINMAATGNSYVPKLGRKHLWKVLCCDCSFHSDPFTKMAATGNSCFWMAYFWKSSPPCLLMDRDKMSTLYRGLPIDTSYQVSVYLAKQF